MDSMRIEEVPELIPEPVRAKTVSLRKPSDAGTDDMDKLEQAIVESREIIGELKRSIVPPSAEKLPFYCINLSYVTDSFTEYKTKSEARHKAAYLLRPAYEGREREVRKAAARAVKDIRRISVYEENFCYCIEHRTLEALRSCGKLLENAGAEPLPDIDKLCRPNEGFDEDDVFELLHDDIVKTNGSFSLESYLSSNGEMIKDDCNGIFNITYRYFGVCNAAQDMKKDIEQSVRLCAGARLAKSRGRGGALLQAYKRPGRQAAGYNDTGGSGRKGRNGGAVSSRLNNCNGFPRRRGVVWGVVIMYQIARTINANRSFCAL